jgi:hypothetical protein
MKDIKKYQGCLLGGAVGDALGYAVEFLQDEQIFRKYGERGITEYSLVDGVAQISDDTQMTLYTANGLLLGTTRGMTRGIMGTYPSYIALCYKDWLKSQCADEFGFEKPEFSWLNNVADMNHNDSLFGVLIIVVTLIFEFLVTLPFTEVASEIDRARWAFLINRELLLTAFPAALITYTFTWLLKTKSRKDALRKGIIWTCVLAFYYILISIGNGSFDLMFGNIGVYVLLVCAFAGTASYSILKRLR